MNRFSGVWRRYALAIAVGGLWSVSYPTPSIAAAAWLVPGLLVALAMGQPRGVAFRIGYWAGLAQFFFSLSWLLYIPFPFGAFCGWLSLGLYLAIYPAGWLWLCATLAGSGQEQRLGASSPQPLTLVGIEVRPWWWRSVWALFAAAGWVGFEMVMGRLFSGFPWNFLGVSQYEILPLIQVASVTGVYGVSFLVVWVSVAACITLRGGLKTAGNPWLFLSDMAIPLGCLFLVCGFGMAVLWSPPTEERSVRLGLVQPSIPQLLIWDSTQDSPRFQQVIELSELALASQPDLLIWPEAAMPPVTEERFGVLTNMLARYQTGLLLGADDVQKELSPVGEETYRYFNSAFLFDADGQYVSRYQKQRLVVFGEYIPLVRWLPFLKWFTPIGAGFTPGPGPAQFKIHPSGLTLSPLICFEDVFPHGVRRHVTEETDLLVNITNDGWFRESAAQWQHMASAAFRSVENRRPLVRCANNGVTCWIDAQGRVREVLGRESREVYGPGFLTIEVPLPPADQPRPRTFYNASGDVFGWACVVITGLGLILAFHRSRHGSG